MKLVIFLTLAHGFLLRAGESLSYRVAMTLSSLKSVGAFLLVGLLIFVTACGTIQSHHLTQTGPRLEPNPPKIYVAPFNTETAKWLIGRQGNFESARGLEHEEFIVDFQKQFQQILVERLQRIAPCETRWVDDLPDEGWLIAGDFKTVYQGSRFLRTVVGFGEGETTLQTRVYVYDLSKSKTKYVFRFDTGIVKPLPNEGSGSGKTPGIVALDPVDAAQNFGAGLKLDSTRTAREIRDVLLEYSGMAPYRK